MQSEKLGPKGTVLPTTCKMGDTFVLIDRANGYVTLHICVVDNAWVAVAGNDVTLAPAVGL